MKPPLPDPTGADFKPQPLVGFSEINPEPVTRWMLRNAWWLAPLLFLASWMKGQVFGP
jgi:hypothetical protein